MADKEYHVVVKTTLQNEIPIGTWTVTREMVDTWVRDWLPGGKDYEHFAENGERVEYVKIMVRDWVEPAWYANVEG